jgi:hypothetical protein
MDQEVILETFILEVLGSNRGWGTNFTGSDFLVVFFGFSTKMPGQYLK